MDLLQREEPVRVLVRDPARAAFLSKVAAEKALLHLHHAQGLPLRIARLAFVYGEGDPHLAESLRWARGRCVLADPVHG